MDLSLKLLGTFVIRDGAGETLSLPTRKARALLAYLAAHTNEPQPRERLASLLWSRSSSRQAGHSLNQALTSIRKLGASIESDSEWVTLQGDGADIDLTRFNALRDEAPQEAVDLYEGPFLDGLETSEPPFDEWLALTRAEVQASAADILERAAGNATKDENLPGAIAFAKQLVALDPLNEESQRLLIRLLRDNGDRATALRQYQAFADILRTELQVEPDAPTRALRDEIRGGSAPDVSAPTSVASTVATEQPPPLPEKPSVAVLPFTNLSRDPEQEYFVDGVVEDILMTLARIPALFVIAQNSSFRYKDQTPDVRDVGRELGVRHVVQGSVRKAGERVRVSAQLVDCNNGRHIWSDHYDGTLANVFDFQDQIALHVATELEIKLVEGEVVAERRRRSREPLAYERFVRARELYAHFSRQAHSQARQLCNEALSIDANCTPALYLLGLINVDQGRFGWVPDCEAAYERALNIADRAFRIDPDYADVYSIISYARTHQRRHDEAVDAAEKAVQFSPNSASAFHMSAMAHIFAGNFNIAHNYELQYCRLSPMAREVALVELARAEFHFTKFEQAREHASKVLETQPSWLTAKTILLAALWRFGHEQEAKQLASAIRNDHPRFDVDRWAGKWPYRDAENLDALIEPLKSAGL